jgi:hypothetical protein
MRFMLRLNANEKAEEQIDINKKKESNSVKKVTFSSRFAEEREGIESNIKKRLKSMQKKKTSQRKVQAMNQWDISGPTVHSFSHDRHWPGYRSILTKTTKYEGFDKPDIETTNILMSEQEHPQRFVSCEVCHGEINTYELFTKNTETNTCRHKKCPTV